MRYSSTENAVFMHIIRRTITPAPSVMSTVFQAAGGVRLTLSLNSMFPLLSDVHREEDRPQYTEDCDDS